MAKSRITEPEEMTIADTREKKIRRKNTTMLKGERLPIELAFNKDLAIILKLAGYTPYQIAMSLGVKKSQVKSWFKDPDVVEKLHKYAEAIPDAARTVLEAYTIEAVHAVAQVMRTAEDSKFILEAAREILNRGGLPAASRTESNVTRTNNTTFSDQGIVEALRSCSPEVQEKAAQVIEGAENALQELVEAGANEEALEAVKEKAEQQVREVVERKVESSGEV